MMGVAIAWLIVGPCLIGFGWLMLWDLARLEAALARDEIRIELGEGPDGWSYAMATRLVLGWLCLVGGVAVSLGAGLALALTAP